MNDADPAQALPRFKSLVRVRRSTDLDFSDSANPPPQLKPQPHCDDMFVHFPRYHDGYRPAQKRTSPTLIDSVEESNLIEKSSDPFRQIKSLPVKNMRNRLLYIISDSYEYINLPGPPGVTGFYIACGAIVTMPYRRTKMVALTRAVLDLLEGADTPLFGFYANAPEGIYVPESSCEKIHGAPKGVKTALGILPSEEVIVVVDGMVKAVILSMWAFRAIRDVDPEGDIGTLAECQSRVPKEKLARKASELEEDVPVLLDGIHERMKNLENKASGFELDRRFRQIIGR